MRILSDAPAALAPWPGPGGWAREPPARWSPAERALWEALGGGGETWAAQRPGGHPYWTLLVARSMADGSQHDRLRALLARRVPLPGPVACLALHGRGLRGQHDRAWHAAPGNLHLSVAFPLALPAAEGPALPMLAAVAVADAISAASGGTLRPAIKWVNDLLLAGGKVGGVLAASQVSGGTLTGAVLGIGVNVAAAPPVEPTPFVPAVSSLAGAGLRLPLAAVLGAVLDALAARVAQLSAEGAGPLLDAYRRDSVVLGREVRVFEDGPGGGVEIARGVVRDVGPDLSLLLDGRAERVTRGRLALVPSEAGEA